MHAQFVTGATLSIPAWWLENVSFSSSDGTILAFAPRHFVLSLLTLGVDSHAMFLP